MYYTDDDITTKAKDDKVNITKWVIPANGDPVTKYTGTTTVTTKTKQKKDSSGNEIKETYNVLGHVQTGKGDLKEVTE